MMKNKKGHFESQSSNDDYQRSFQAKQYGYGTIEVMKTNWDLLTHCICLGLGTSSVSEEVRELGSNQNILLCEHLGVKPHESFHARFIGSATVASSLATWWRCQA